MKMEIVKNQFIIDGEMESGYSPFVISLFSQFAKGLLCFKVCVMRNFVFDFNKPFMTFGEQIQPLIKTFLNLEVAD